MPRVDEPFVAKMDDVLETYKRPYDPREPVVCLDGAPVVLREDARPARRVTRRGQVLRRDYEYVRRGSANVFLAIEPKTGRRLVRPTARREAPAFAQTLAALAERYRRTRTVHVVMDNLNTHAERSPMRAFGARRGRAPWRRFAPHFTPPQHASWLNQAERTAEVPRRGKK